MYLCAHFGSSIVTVVLVGCCSYILSAYIVYVRVYVCTRSLTLKPGCLRNEGGVHSTLATEVVDKTSTSVGSSGGETSCTLPGLARAKPL